MRERQIKTGMCMSSAGITPAYAGKTLCTQKATIADQDHPRVCGKDYYADAPEFWCWGSPPRMRERQNAARANMWHFRITPAYAGKTEYINGVNFWCEDHPRVCGKDCPIVIFTHLA